MLARDLAYQQLRKILLSGSLSPDEPLSERGLAERLNVGRMPVREALKELEKDRLVRIVRGRGSFIRQLTIDEVRDIYETRQALEGMAARLATLRGVTTELLAVERRMKELEIFNDAEIREVQEAGIQFHDEVVRASCNRELICIYHTLDARIALSLRLTAELKPSRSRVANGEHLKILEAIKLGFAELAEQLMREHLAHGIAARVEILSGIGGRGNLLINKK